MTKSVPRCAMYIGVVGYLPPSEFDEKEALLRLQQSFDDIDRRWPDQLKAVVSGLTDVGIHAIAYREAERRGWMTVGICCRRAFDHNLYPCAVKVFAGKDFGDDEEVRAFTKNLNCLVRIGDGPISRRITEQLRNEGLPIWEHD
ncbi:MAG: hypothetical protein V1738_04055 [Patescibacteria group bacterium]